MAETQIEWADAVWNPVTGCTPISEGCEHCYARRMAYRLRGRYGYPEDNPFCVTLHPERLGEPRKISGDGKRIFVCSMGDLFHPSVPDEFIARVWAVMQLEVRHYFIVLTKRPERLLEIYPRLQELMEIHAEDSLKQAAPCTYGPWPLPNVWIGVTAENQQRADERIPILLQIPAAVHWVSCEPLLGPIDLSPWLKDWSCPVCSGTGVVRFGMATKRCPKQCHRSWKEGCQLHWVICGGETGPNARPMHPDWVRSLRDQCQAASVPFFFKHWGEWREDSFAWANLSSRPSIDVHGTCFVRIGRKTAGRLLDGRTWDEFPQAR